MNHSVCLFPELESSCSFRSTLLSEGPTDNAAVGASLQRQLTKSTRWHGACPSLCPRLVQLPSYQSAKTGVQLPAPTSRAISN